MTSETRREIGGDKVKVRDIYELIDQATPYCNAWELDNVGLNVGSMEQEVTGIVTCVDATREVIEVAKEKGANLIVSHHPLLFSKTKTITDANRQEGLSMELLKNSISLIASHTNTDSTEGGINEFLADYLDVKDVSIVGKYLRIGNHDKMKLRDLAHEFKEKLKSDITYVIGDIDCEVSRIAVHTGSADVEEFVEIDETFDVVVLGELSYPKQLEVQYHGLNAIVVGHRESEQIFCDWFVQLMQKNDLDKEVKVYMEKENKLCYLID